MNLEPTIDGYGKLTINVNWLKITEIKVKVEKVCILNAKGKTKRHGGRLGKRTDLRKAYVSLQGTADIDFAGSK